MNCGPPADIEDNTILPPWLGAGSEAHPPPSPPPTPEEARQRPRGLPPGPPPARRQPVGHRLAPQGAVPGGQEGPALGAGLPRPRPPREEPPGVRPPGR